ncbi:ATP-binding protein [bacterium]|nr:ATP-binding protein [bacterium]
MTQPKQLVILSGKGGTGKTSLCAALAQLSAESSARAVTADADVDASNLALVTEAETQSAHPFSSSLAAVIDPQRCTNCGRCDDVCRFEAIRAPQTRSESYETIPLLCEGCGACVVVCPAEAIRMETQEDGEWRQSRTPYGTLYHAELFPAAENSGKLVTLVKQHAKLDAEDHQTPLILVDGPPGVGCPVISASAGADLALIVTEPGLSGIHDLARIAQTLQHFKIPAVIAINKADIYPEGTREIHRKAAEFGYRVIAEIPFDPALPQAMTAGQPITRHNPTSPAAHAIRQTWDALQTILFEEAANDRS